MKILEVLLDQDLLIYKTIGMLVSKIDELHQYHKHFIFQYQSAVDSCTKFLKDNKVEQTGQNVMYIFESSLTLSVLLNDFRINKSKLEKGNDEEIDNILNALRSDFEEMGCELYASIPIFTNMKRGEILKS